MKTIQLKNIVWKEGKHYVAQCLNIDISSFGKTKKEAISELQDAIDLYFKDTNKKTFLKIERPEVISSVFKYA